MSLDTSFHIIYGYKVNGTKLTDDIQKYTSKEKEWILPNSVHYDDFIEDLDNSDDLALIEDYMCGDYCYIGIPIIYKSEEYGEPWNFEFDPMWLPQQCDEEKLDELIKEKIPFIVGNEYDGEVGLLYGKLPKVYIVKRVW